MHRPLRQDLQQRRRAGLRPAPREVAESPAQGTRRRLFLRGHDCAGHPHGHETAPPGGRVPAGWQVSDLFSFGKYSASV